MTSVEEAAGGYYFTTSPTSQATKPASPSVGASNLVPKVSNNSTISSVGALRLYEFLLGIFFIAFAKFGLEVSTVY